MESLQNAGRTSRGRNAKQPVVNKKNRKKTHVKPVVSAKPVVSSKPVVSPKVNFFNFPFLNSVSTKPVVSTIKKTVAV